MKLRASTPGPTTTPAPERMATIHPDDVDLVEPGDWLCFDAIDSIYRLPRSVATARQAQRAAAIAAAIATTHWNPEA